MRQKLSAAQRRYLATESSIGVASGGILSLAFTWTLFRDQAHVAMQALVIDSVPQSFMVVLMATLVPGLLTRRRIMAGALAGSAQRLPAPSRLVLRALLAAAAATTVATCVHAILLWVDVQHLSLRAVLIYKSVYGALLGGAAVVWSVGFLIERARQPDAGR